MPCIPLWAIGSSVKTISQTFLLAYFGVLKKEAGNFRLNADAGHQVLNGGLIESMIKLIKKMNDITQNTTFASWILTMSTNSEIGIVLNAYQMMLVH